MPIPFEDVENHQALYGVEVFHPSLTLLTDLFDKALDFCAITLIGRGVVACTK